MMMQQGYGISGLVGGLLIFITKILMVVLVLSLVAGLLSSLRKYFLKDGQESKICQAISQNPTLKVATVVTAVVLGLLLVMALFCSLGMGGMGYGFNPMFSIAWLIVVIIKILMLVAVISLAAPLVFNTEQQNEEQQKAQENQ